METAEKRPVENAMQERNVEKVTPPGIAAYKRSCQNCGRKTVDKHESICLECGWVTQVCEVE